MPFIQQFGALFLIPLIPAIVLWGALRQLPEATASALSFRGIDFELTGAAAGYVVFVLLGFTGHRLIVTSKAERLLERERLVKERAKELQGTWLYEEEVYFTQQAGADRLARRGTVTVAVDAERVLHLHGERLDRDGNVIQQWRSERVFLLENELFIFFQVPAINGRAQFSGVAQLSLRRENGARVDEMCGHFSALNLPRYGNIRLVRKDT